MSLNSSQVIIYIQFKDPPQGTPFENTAWVSYRFRCKIIFKVRAQYRVSGRDIFAYKQSKPGQ